MTFIKAENESTKTSTETTNPKRIHNFFKKLSNKKIFARNGLHPITGKIT